VNPRANDTALNAADAGARFVSSARALANGGSRKLFVGLLIGLVAGIGAAAFWFHASGSASTAAAGSSEGAFDLPSILRVANADLDDGDYAFFPNRRSIWIVNRTNGRMANYHFRDDELGSVDRSRVSAIDLKTFPRKDTVIYLSDRNMNNILWVCNTRTGDIQIWSLARDGSGSLRAEGPVGSSIDLIERTSAK
jgi:hypothetical protein